MSEKIEELAESSSGQRNEQNDTQIDENQDSLMIQDPFRNIRAEIRTRRSHRFDFESHLTTVPTQSTNMAHYTSQRTQSRLDGPRAAVDRENHSRPMPYHPSDATRTQGGLGENEEQHLSNDGAQASHTISQGVESDLNTPRARFSQANSSAADDLSSILAPENLRRNEGQINEARRVPLANVSPPDAPLRRHRIVRRSEDHWAAPRHYHPPRLITPSSSRVPGFFLQSYEDQNTQANEPRDHSIPPMTSGRLRDLELARLARRNAIDHGVRPTISRPSTRRLSASPSRPLESPQMMHPVTNDVQLNFSFSSRNRRALDRILPRRTISGVFESAVPSGASSPFDTPLTHPERPFGRNQVAAAYAEINRPPGRNTHRPPPLSQVEESPSYADEPTYGDEPTEEIEQPLLEQVAAQQAAITTLGESTISEDRLEARRMLREMRARRAYNALSLSQRRNQHSNDVRLEVIKELLVSTSTDGSEACPICQEGYTAVSEASTSEKELHTCPDCEEQYTTTPNIGDGDAHDACAIRGCSHVFGRCCITQWLKNKYTCPLCRAKVSLP